MGKTRQPDAQNEPRKASDRQQPTPPFPQQHQERPGLEADMTPAHYWWGFGHRPRHGRALRPYGRQHCDQLPASRAAECRGDR